MLVTLALFQVLALEGATVHTMAPGVEPAQVTVLVENGEFIAIGADLEVPADAIRVDLTGKHLFPGLIDGMVHHDLEHDPLYVLSGITTAQDMGNDLAQIFLSAMPTVRNQMPGPYLHVSGAVFDGIPPATTEAVIARNEIEVQNKLPRLIEQGANFASFHTGLPQPAWQQLIASGRELGVQVWGPLLGGNRLMDTLTSGQSGLTYLEGFQLPDGTTTVEHDDELVQAYVDGGVASMPLLHVYGYRTEDQGDDPPIFALLALYYGDWWKGDLQQRRSLFTEAYLEQGRQDYDRRKELVLKLWKAGVPMLPGSAAPNPWMAPGAGLHDELSAWEDAGIPLDSVLHGATLGAAQVLGLDATRGSIEIGKIADAVVLDHDPRQGLENLREPHGVLMRGGYMDQAFLSELRSALYVAHEASVRKATLPIVIETPELPEGRVVLQGRVVSRAFDRIVAAEEYWVVRTYEGDTAWVSKMVTTGSLTESDTVQTLVQRFNGEGHLETFNYVVNPSGQAYRVEGLRQGGKFRIKRWLNGNYVDTNTSSTRPHLVDAGMALSPMILAHYRKDGNSSTIYFDGYDPVMGTWDVLRYENGNLGVRTSEGPMVAMFEENGALAKLSRSQGRAVIHYQSEASDSFGGPGIKLIPYVAPVELVEEPEVGEGASSGDPK